MTSIPHQTEAKKPVVQRRARRARRSLAANDRRGASLVEFALLAPVMFLFIFGIVEFARLMMVHEAMTNAAREACREASLATTLNAADAENMARNVMADVTTNAADPQKVKVTVNPASLASISSGTPVTVTVQLNFADIAWIPQSLAGLTGSRVLTTQATFDRE